MKVSDCKIIDLPKIGEPSGNLTFIESARHVPFQIARVYYLYDVPGGAQRGGHAHKVVEEFLVAISGSFDVVLDDGRDQGALSPQSTVLRFVHSANDLERTG